MRLTGQVGLIREIIHIQQVPRIIISGCFEVVTRVCLPDMIHLKIACSEVSGFEREAKRVQRLMAEVVQAASVEIGISWRSL